MELEKLSKKAPFPFLVANLVDAQSGEPIFGDHRVIERGGVKVGVFGVTLEAVPATPTYDRGAPWRVTDTEAAAKAQVAALKGEGAQVIVALAHLPDRELDDLARNVPGIDFILGGNDTGMQEHPRHVADAFIATAFSKGKYLSLFNLHLWKDKAPTGPFADRFERAGLEKQMEQLEAQIGSYETIAEAREKSEREAAQKSPEPGGVTSRRAAGAGSEFYRNQIVRLRTEKAQLEARIEDGAKVDPDANYFAYDLVPAGKTIEDDPAIGKAVEAFRKKYPKAPGH
ncbi:MAG: hypothetical protein H6744_16370 [Deltaproteobacteria bacterium]|nr:hypothetical protein [Deltaproteobacteria bacterium]MCB9788257.1 hypothetical protein [Deltaproteobacteria bacterium]